MSWVSYSPEHPFPIQNLPFGVGVVPGAAEPRPVTTIGDFIVDLSQLGKIFDGDVAAAFQAVNLNTFMALGYDKWQSTRQALTKVFSKDEPLLRDDAELQKKVLFDTKSVKLVLPCKVGDYTDFFASREHATNMGKMFRPGGNPLQENWLHLPVGYHGRASSIVISGTDIVRPNGQQRPNPEAPPVFGPTKAVDFELEMAAYIGTSNKLGEPLNLADARKAIFGFSLFNDWTARDIQKWEYVPLGPFLGKNFGSTISPWIVTTFALEPFLVDGPEQDPKPLAYLEQGNAGPSNFDVQLTAAIQPEGAVEPSIVTRSNYKYMYWSVYQQLVHHAINGCNMQPGDIIASGTLSAPTEGGAGAMIELSWSGKNPVPLEKSPGQERRMIQDGDVVILGGEAVGDGYRIGFGPCDGKVVPAKNLGY